MDGIVIFGDVVRSRRDAAGSTAWLRTLAAELDTAVPAANRLAEFEFTQGDELQGLLAPGIDPFGAILRAGLHPERRPMRWVVVAGDVDPGNGPATQRTGPAFLRARERLVEAAARRDGLVVESGDPAADALLDDVAPLLAELLDDLTDRQRVVARLILVEGLRRSKRPSGSACRGRRSRSRPTGPTCARSGGWPRRWAGCSPRARRSRPRGGWARHRSGRMRPWRRRLADRCPPTRS